MTTSFKNCPACSGIKESIKANQGRIISVETTQKDNVRHQQEVNSRIFSKLDDAVTEMKDFKLVSNDRDHALEKSIGRRMGIFAAIGAIGGPLIAEAVIFLVKLILGKG